MDTLDSELRSADAELAAARVQLVAVMAAARRTQRQQDALHRRQIDYERHAVQALQRGDEALAGEVAGYVAGLERRGAQLGAEYEARSAAASRLRQAVRRTEAALGRLRAQADVARAAAAVECAGPRAADASSGVPAGTLPRLQASADDAQLRSAEVRALVESVDAMLGVHVQEADADDELDARLRAAGVRTVPGAVDADSVLERLRLRLRLHPAPGRSGSNES